MPTKYLALILLVSLSATASAQRRWKEIGKTSAGNPIYIDPASVKTVKGIITARIRVKFIEPVHAPNGVWKSSQHVAMFDCAQKKLAAKESAYYSDEAGTRLIERNTIALPGYGPAIGGSMTQVALDYVCKK